MKLFLLFLFAITPALAIWVEVESNEPCGELSECPAGTKCYRPDQFDIPRICLGYIVDLQVASVKLPPSGNGDGNHTAGLLGFIEKHGLAFVILLAGFVFGINIVFLCVYHRQFVRSLNRLLRTIPPYLALQTPEIPTIPHNRPILRRPSVSFANPPVISNPSRQPLLNKSLSVQSLPTGTIASSG